MRRLSLFAAIVSAFLAWPVDAQQTVLRIGGTPVQGGTAGNCLTIGNADPISGMLLNNAPCSSGSSGVSTFSAGLTGLTPNSATTGAVTLGGNLSLTAMAQIAANTLMGNATSGTTTPQAIAVPSCSGATNALGWTTSSGFLCNNISAGTGNVVGPASSTDNLVATFDGTTGKLLKSTGTPALGTPTSATLTNATGLPIGSGVSGLGTGVATALGVNAGAAGAFVVNGGALGTPSGGTATNLTGLPTTGLTGTLQASQFPALTGDVTTSAGALGTTLATVNSNVGSFGSATQVGTFTVNAKGLITAAANVTATPAVGSITGLGTGVATALAANVGSAGAPVLFNGAGGTPSSLTLTNATGLPIAGLTGNQASYVWSSSAASGSTVSFTSLSCEDVLIYVDGVTITTSTADLNILFSTNNGSTYTSASRINVTASALTTSAVYLTEWITGLRGGYVRAFGGESTTGNPNSTPNVSTAGPRTVMFAPAAQVNAIRFAPSASTFAAGNFRVGCRG